MLLALELSPGTVEGPAAQIRFADGTRDALVQWGLSFMSRVAPREKGCPVGAFQAQWRPELTTVVDRIMTAFENSDIPEVVEAAWDLHFIFGVGANVPIASGRFKSDNRIASSPGKMTEAVIPLQEGLLLQLLSAAVASAQSASPTADAAGAWIRLQAIKATICGQPLLVEADHVRALRNGAAGHASPQFQALREVFSSLTRLSQRRLVPAPQMVCAAASEQPADASLLQDLLAPGTGLSPEQEPRPTMSQWLRDLQEPTSADRGAGRWSVVGGPPGASTFDLKFAPLPASATQQAMAAQDREIQALRDFALVHFAPSLHKHRMAVSRRGDDITVGTLPVATRAPDGQWIPDPSALKAALSTTAISAPPMVSTIDRWERRHGLRRGSEPPSPSKDVRQLRLLLQMAPKDRLTDERRRGHPDEAVWIQLDRSGRQQVVAGSALLGRLASHVQLKLEIDGNVTVCEAGSLQLSFYSPEVLVERVKLALQSLGISLAACRVTLMERMAHRAASGSFAEEFLRSGIARGLLTRNAEVTTYSEPLVLSGRIGHRLLAPLVCPKIFRTTQTVEGAKPQCHAPETTWVYRLDPVTDRVVRRDKYPAPPAARVAYGRGVACCDEQRFPLLGASPADDRHGSPASLDDVVVDLEPASDGFVDLWNLSTHRAGPLTAL